MATHSHKEELHISKFEAPQSLKTLAFAFTGIGLLGFLIGFIKNPEAMWPNYLTAFFFVSCLSLGGMFFTVIQHITKAGWSSGIRRLSEGMTAFMPVIVFLREGRGGFMYIANETSKQRMSLKERLLHEVSRSIQVAYGLCNLLDEYHVDLEVHADINTNPHFQSNTALQEAMGYILSMGFVFRAKPDSFASSSCANKVV